MSWRPRALGVTAALMVVVMAGPGPARALEIPASAQAPAAVPYQYVAKIYTELLGRAPVPTEWRGAVALLAHQGCNTAALEVVADRAVRSIEYRTDYPPGPAQNPAIVLTVYRAVLDRDPSPAEFVLARDLLDAGQLSAVELVTRLFATPEFALLTQPAICNPSSPAYGFGQPGHPGKYVATQTPATGPPGPDASEFLLQLALDHLSQSGGGTFTLAPRAVVALTDTLVVPGNVTLTTQGSPGPQQYAQMAHLARSPWYAPPATDAGPVLVLVEPGAHVEHIWVDGQRQSTDPNVFLQFDVRMMGGVGTTVAFDRLGDPFGATVLEADGSDSGIPGAAQCHGNVVSHNLVEGYGTSHIVPAGEPDDHPQSDGLGIYCQDASVVGNNIVDASDTGVAVFDGASYLTAVPVQHSLVARNVVVSAGNSYSFGIVTDPSYSLDAVATKGGDAPGVLTRAFSGGDLRTRVVGNELWSGRRTHFDVLLGVGTHDLFGSTAHQDCFLPDPKLGRATCGGGRNSFGPSFTGNGDAGLGATVQMGVYVGGTTDALVRGNRLPGLREVQGGTCPKAAVVVATGGASPSFTAGLQIDTPVMRDRTLQSDACVTPAF